MTTPGEGGVQYGLMVSADAAVGDLVYGWRDGRKVAYEVTGKEPFGGVGFTYALEPVADLDAG